jgi:hypothetical protein
MLVHISFGSLVLLSANYALHPLGWLKQLAISPGLTQQAREASDLLGQDIRQASSVQSATANEIVLSTPEGTVMYTYSAAFRTLIRVEGAKSKTVLTSVDSFSFSLFQRPGVNESFNTLPPAIPEEARLVGCRWSCSQRIAGAKLDTDAFQVAPTLLRGR